MRISHIHFYVEDVEAQRDWFIRCMGCFPCGSKNQTHTRTEILRYGSVGLLISSSLRNESPVSAYLAKHPPGVVDIALIVQSLDTVLTNAGTRVLQSIQETETLRWAVVAGWDSIQHTLIESKTRVPWQFLLDNLSKADSFCEPNFPEDRTIDHVVLNVATGDLDAAARFYQQQFNLKPRQHFKINTPKSGLRSQVLSADAGGAYFNINEPIGQQSQIQVFLDANCGAGIQHVAFKSRDLVKDVLTLRKLGLPFLSIPDNYYRVLRYRLLQNPSLLSDTQLRAIAAQEILVDWRPDVPQSLLLQIFSKPILPQPTFFLSSLNVVSRLGALGSATFKRFTRQLNQSWTWGSV